MNFSELGNLPGLPEQTKGIVKLFNKVIRKLGFNYDLTPLPNGRVLMHTVEQRINFSLLAMCNLVYNVPGEWAEFVCYNGQSAMVFQKVLDKYKPGSKIMLYDSFNAKYALNEDIKQNLLSNFKKQGLAEPLLIEGNFFDTIPAQLMDMYSLVHIDCGVGGDQELHQKLVGHLLHHIYPRLSKGAVLLLMDYHDTITTIKGAPINPGVKAACEHFFADKPEKVISLYGNQYSHGFIFKM
jgi:O-methyltransferase